MGLFRDLFGTVDRDTADEYRDLVDARHDQGYMTDQQEERLLEIERTLPAQALSEVERLAARGRWW